MFTQRIFAWKILLRELMADDDRLRMAGAVPVRKKAPAQ